MTALSHQSESPPLMHIDYSSLKMSNGAFKRIQNYIQSEVGIKLPPVKKTMLQARLQKRLRQLALSSFEAYCDFVFSNAGHSELIQMIDVITTNKTDFFREPSHFDHLFHTAIPWLRQEQMISSGRPLKLWSAGCSTGEEPYTLAMLLMHDAAFEKAGAFNIMATDISTQVLDKARMGIYAEERIAPVPDALKKKFILRSKDKNRRQIRMIPPIRQAVTFHRVNFMDEDYGIRQKFHIIFCRNVIIYFDRPTQQRIISKLIANLHGGGFLYLGHSETLHGLNLPLESIAPTIYQYKAY